MYELLILFWSSISGGALIFSIIGGVIGYKKGKEGGDKFIWYRTIGYGIIGAIGGALAIGGAWTVAWLISLYT